MRFSGAALSSRIRGSQPCSGTMRGARSGQAEGAALQRHSTPRSSSNPRLTCESSGNESSRFSLSVSTLDHAKSRTRLIRRRSICASAILRAQLRRKAGALTPAIGSANPSISRFSAGSSRAGIASPCRKGVLCDLRFAGCRLGPRASPCVSPVRISSRGPDQFARREEVEAISPSHPVATVRAHGELRFSVGQRERSSNRSSQ